MAVDRRAQRRRPSDAAAALSAVDAIAADLPASPRVLVTGPPGSGKSRLVLAALDAALERDGPDRVLLLLPTYGEVEHQKRVAISRREERRLARAVLDAPYATFTSLAERLSAEFRVRDLPSRRERDLLADEALRRADVAAFRAVRDRPGFRARFLRLVKELKQSGEPPADLRTRLAAAREALGPSARERLDGFLRAWAVYDDLLAAAGRPDHEDVLRDLLGAVRRAAARLSGTALLVVDGFEDLTGVEASLLEAATDAVTAGGGRVLVTLPWDPTRPRLFRGSEPLRERLIHAGRFLEHRVGGFRRASSPALVRLAERLFLDGAPPADLVEPGVDVRSIVGSDEADEMDRIGREILRLLHEEPEVARSYRDVGIVLRRLDGRGAGAQRALAALGIPSRLVGGGPRLSSEALVRAVRGPLALLSGDDGAGETDFDALRLVDWLRWRALASGEPVPIDAVDRVEIAWRRDGLPLRWEDARARLREADATLGALADDLDARRATAQRTKGSPAVWAFLERTILDLLPLPASRGVDADGRPLDPEGDECLRRAIAARERLLGLAREAARAARRTGLSGVEDVRGGVEDLLASADEAVSAPTDRRLDTVHLLDAEEARHWELPVVFVAGLVEKEFPLHPTEDVLLRDDDRTALRDRLAQDGASPAWRTARDAEDGERRLFLAAVTRARRRLYLTRPAADENGRERGASFFWRDVNDALGLPAEDVRRLGRPADDLGRSCVAPAAAWSAGDLLRSLAHPLGALARPEGEPGRRLAVALARAGGDRVAGVLARASRFWRPTADPLPASVRPRFSARVETVSPTALTAGRACLHRFFLLQVAKVGEDETPFTGPGFDRRAYGEMLHALLEAAVREPEATPEALAAAVVAAKADVFVEAADRAWAQADLERAARLFRLREAEAAASGYAPLPRDLEWKFGRGGSEVRLGAEDGLFRLTGAIDRLDVDDPARPRRAIVVDYKTSPTSAEGAAERLRDAEDLQLPLYAKAVEGLRGVTVVGLELYAAMRRGRWSVGSEVAAEALERRAEEGEALVLTASDFRGVLDKAERVASGIVAAVRRGEHAKAPLDRSTCDDCPVLAVCRPDTSRFHARADEEDADA